MQPAPNLVPLPAMPNPLTTEAPADDKANAVAGATDKMHAALGDKVISSNGDQHIVRGPHGSVAGAMHAGGFKSQRLAADMGGRGRAFTHPDAPGAQVKMPPEMAIGGHVALVVTPCDPQDNYIVQN